MLILKFEILQTILIIYTHSQKHEIKTEHKGHLIKGNNVQEPRAHQPHATFLKFPPSTRTSPLVSKSKTENREKDK